MSTPQAARPLNRHRALASLDIEIDRAERTRARCALDVEDMTAGGRDTRRAQAMLNMADERLGLLRGSRPVLTSGAVSAA